MHTFIHSSLCRGTMVTRSGSGRQMASPHPCKCLVLGSAISSLARCTMRTNRAPTLPLMPKGGNQSCSSSPPCLSAPSPVRCSSRYDEYREDQYVRVGGWVGEKRERERERRTLRCACCVLMWYHTILILPISSSPFFLYSLLSLPLPPQVRRQSNGKPSV